MSFITGSSSPWAGRAATGRAHRASTATRGATRRPRPAKRAAPPEFGSPDTKRCMTESDLLERAMCFGPAGNPALGEVDVAEVGGDRERDDNPIFGARFDAALVLHDRPRLSLYEWCASDSDRRTFALGLCVPRAAFAPATPTVAEPADPRLALVPYAPRPLPPAAPVRTRTSIEGHVVEPAPESARGRASASVSASTSTALSLRRWDDSTHAWVEADEFSSGPTIELLPEDGLDAPRGSATAGCGDEEDSKGVGPFPSVSSFPTARPISKSEVERRSSSRALGGGGGVHSGAPHGDDGGGVEDDTATGDEADDANPRLPPARWGASSAFLTTPATTVADAWWSASPTSTNSTFFASSPSSSSFSSSSSSSSSSFRSPTAWSWSSSAGSTSRARPSLTPTPKEGFAWSSASVHGTPFAVAWGR